jgi:isoleucyl-tRNA synthetase
LLALRAGVQKQLELKRAEKVIGSSLEAKVGLELSADWLTSLLAKKIQFFLQASGKISSSNLENSTKEKAFTEFLREFLIVSAVEIKWVGCSAAFIGEHDGFMNRLKAQVDQLKVQVDQAEGEKCPRCWVISPNLNSSERFPGVCPKCVDHLSENLA